MISFELWLTHKETQHIVESEEKKMVNTQLLDERIEASGLKISHIVENLGLSRQGFDKKRKGITPFRVAEIYVISDLLRLTNDEKSKIFYSES